MHTLSVQRVDELIAQCTGKRIAVIGDVMLDRYFWGSVHRVSPEAPVPVVDIVDESFHLGGASNVANNLKSLGADPLMLGVVGDDNSGRTLTDILSGSGMETAGIIVDETRPTTVKTRIIGNNQQIARLDREVKQPIGADVRGRLLEALEQHANEICGIVLQDYNKGVITSALISQTIKIAHRHGIAVFVDPKHENFFEYKSVTLLKPNIKETQDALGIKIQSDEELHAAGRELLERLQCEHVLVTLGARGMMLFSQKGEPSSVKARARHVADVSGAGDTVIATIAAAMAGGALMTEAATLANFAAGVVCEEPGIVSIETDDLRRVIRQSE